MKPLVHSSGPRARRVTPRPGRRGSGRACPVFATLGLLLLGGCNQLEGAGEMAGRLDLPGCTGLGDTFAMSFDFFSVEPFAGGGLVIRLQQGGRGLETSEGLMFTLLDFEELRRRRGEALPVTPLDPAAAAAGELLACATVPSERPAGCPLLRAALNLPEHCPPEAIAPALGGVLVFAHLGTGKNDRVAGHFELTVSDPHGSEEWGELTGEFDFFVQQGHPYRRFPR